MRISGPLALGLALAPAFAARWPGGRSTGARGWLDQADELRRASAERAGGSVSWLGEVADQTGPRLAQAAELGSRAAETAATLGSRAGETATVLGTRAGETASVLGSRAGETAATIKPLVGRLATEASGTLGEASSQVAVKVGGAATELRRATFRTIRNLTIVGALGGLIVYIYAPEREQQQQLLENVQGVAFGLVDFGKGVQQLVNDLRAS